MNPCEASSSERTGVSLSSLRGGWVGEDGRKKERRSSQYYPRCPRELLVFVQEFINSSLYICRTKSTHDPTLEVLVGSSQLFFF